VGIVAEDVARVREATDFVALASEHIALRRVGRRWVGLCPFHMEKTPSLSINAEDGFFHCFGCSKGGDAITFIRDIEHLDFVEAVEKLAARAGITLHYDEGQNRDQQRRSRLTEVLEAAVDWYHQLLLSAPEAAAARSYLRAERGYDGETVRRYRLGWAPAGWNRLQRSLNAPAGLLAAAGLVNPGERGPVDAFRERLLFPIFDPAGRPLGFGGRVLPGGRGPKYKNSAATPIYDKSRVLYGLNWAKPDVVARDRVVVCEGYTDVIGLHRAGVGEAVATCGTALADGHIRLLTRFARRLVLAYDADGAGQAAADRVYEWERRFEVDVAVAALPPGADPADVARRDPEALHKAVEEARPYLDFRLERLLGAADLRTAEGRARAATAAMDLIGGHPNSLVRDQYLMAVADRCRIEPERLRALAAGDGPQFRDGPRLRDGRRPPDGPLPGAGAGPDASPLPGPEVEALRLAIHRPQEVADRLELALFAHPRTRAAFTALAGADTLHQAMENADPGTAGLLSRLAVEEADADTDDVTVRLVERAGQRALGELSRQARAVADPAQMAATVAWVKPALEELRADPDSGARPRDAETRLLAWLVAREEAGDG
jgi:DNA primase